MFIPDACVLPRIGADRRGKTQQRDEEAQAAGELLVWYVSCARTLREPEDALPAMLVVESAAAL